MTVTEHQAAATDTGSAAPAAPPSQPGGLAAVIGTTDHKTIGKLYLGFSAPLLLVALALSAVVDAEGLDASGFEILADNTFFQVFTLSRVALVFLGVLPAIVGLALHIVPLQVGAHSVAFPRAAAASFWGWLLGSGLLIAAYLTNGGPAGGNADAVRLSLAAMLLVLVSLALGLVCVITTVATVRANGMTLLQVPVFAWAMFVAGSVWLLNIAVLVGNVVVITVDTMNEAVLYGAPAVVWPQLEWFFGQPATLSLVVPALGITADVVATMTGRRLGRYPVVLGTLGAVAALGFGGWAQTVFNPELATEAAYVALSVAALLPALGFAGGIADTLRQGRPRLAAATGLALISLLGGLATAAAGAAYALPFLNLAGTTWHAGVAKLAIGTAITGVAAGQFYWGGKIWGRTVIDAAGKLLVPVLLLGTALFAGADLVAGALGQVPVGADGLFTATVDGAELLAGLSAAGAAVLALGVVLIVLAVLPAAFGGGRPAEDDPYDGHTLEWATSSPPAWDNFPSPIATVGSPEPMTDLREAATAGGQ
jgi:cytochrome c oxidase subunit 1